MLKFKEMGNTVSFMDQVQQEDGEPVILINTFVVEPGDARALLEVWAQDAEVMKRQPGFISAQLHRGTCDSDVFLNYSVWQSVDHYRAAFNNPDFQSFLAKYPESATASPHLFRKVAIDNVCTA